VTRPQAAQAVETCLLRQLIDASGVFKGAAGTAGSQIHSQMFVEALADAVEKGGGIGLARLIENSLPAGAMTWLRPTANFLQSLPLILLKSVSIPLSVRAPWRRGSAMMIKNTTSVGGVEPAASKPQTEAAAPRLKSDSVSTADAAKAAALARAGAGHIGLSHSARLAQIEGAIRAGSYAPSASELADRLVSAAEIDARLQAMLGG